MSKLLKSVGIISFFTLFSRVLGLVREILMARFFGTQVTASAFGLAFRIPNLFRRLFGEGALTAGFIPVFIEVREHQGPHAANQLAGGLFMALGGGLTLVALVIAGGASMAMPLVSEENQLVLTLLQIMIPYMVFICLTALCIGMLQSVGHFALPAATPLLLNGVWIATLLLGVAGMEADPSSRIQVVAWGILVAGVVQLGAQWPLLRKHDIGFKRPEPDRWHEVKRVFRNAFPAMISAGVTQINVMVDSVLAWWVAPYGVAALTYSERLIYLPLGVLATALGTVLLPTYSRQQTLKNTKEFGDTFHTSFRFMCFIILPAATGLFILAEPIITLFFQRGEFDATSTLYTKRALLCYAPGLFVFSLAKILLPAFYAMQDTKTPMRISFYTIGLNIILNVFFVIVLPEGWKHAGLALGTVLAECVYMGILLGIFRKRIQLTNLSWLVIAWLKALFASLFMAITVSISIRKIGSLSTDDPMGSLLQVLIGILLGGLSYVLISYLLRSRELKDMLQKFIHTR